MSEKDLSFDIVLHGIKQILNKAGWEVRFIFL